MTCNNFYVKSRVTSPDFSPIYWPPVLVSVPATLQLPWSLSRSTRSLLCTSHPECRGEACAYRPVQVITSTRVGLTTPRVRAPPGERRGMGNNTCVTHSLPPQWSQHVIFFLSACSLTPFLCLLPACALRTLRSKKQQSSSGGLSLSLSQAATPRKTLSFSAVNTPVNSGIFEESSTATDAAQLTSLDQSRPRQRTVTTATTFSCLDGHSGELWKTRYNLSSIKLI